MANTKSAKKAIRSQKRKNVVNNVWRKKLLEAKKDFLGSLSNKDKASSKNELLKKLNFAKKMADKAHSHGPFHKNKSARIKSMLDKRFSLLSKSK